MAKDVIFQDVYEAFIKNSVTGELKFFGATSGTEISQTVKQEPIRAGIGNGVFSLIQSDKEIKFTVTNAVHNDGIIEIQSGSELGTGKFAVPVSEVVVASTAGEIPLSQTPDGMTVTLTKTVDGETVAGASTYTETDTLGVISDRKVSNTAITSGESYTVYYKIEKDVKLLDLNSDSFPKNQEVILHSIAYDPETNEVISDVYWEFPKALPDGEIKISGKGGENSEATMNFTAQLPKGSKSYGKYIVVDR